MVNAIRRRWTGTRITPQLDGELNYFEIIDTNKQYNSLWKSTMYILFYIKQFRRLQFVTRLRKFIWI